MLDIDLLESGSHLALGGKALLLGQFVPSCTLLFTDVAWQPQARPTRTAMPLCDEGAALNSKAARYMPTALWVWIRCAACLLLEPLQ